MVVYEAVATLLAISLAGERIVVMVKALAPRWFQEEKPQPGVQPPTAVEDSGRRLRVQLVAFASCWAASAAMVVAGEFHPFGSIQLGGATFPVILAGLLTMGGSAFWTQVLGIASALKDLKQVQAAAERTADVPGTPPGGTGPSKMPFSVPVVAAPENARAPQHA